MFPRSLVIPFKFSDSGKTHVSNANSPHNSTQRSENSKLTENETIKI